ncbi:MAG: type II toxin-antitoxin system RelE/ParE family toxin [Anaerolineae bacterium]|nr:type II toxin-antitoxin system RelE/ParE family toxin [Anaerolineae bacterium]
MYRVRTASRRVEKEIAALPRHVRERVIEAIQKLAENPHPQGARKLMGEMGGAWRVRVGDYRVIYDVDDDKRVVIILAALHRREAYRRR